MSLKHKLKSMSREELLNVVANSDSLAGIIRTINATMAGANYKLLKEYLATNDIDFSHIKLGLNNNLGRKKPSNKLIPLELVTVECSTYSRGHLKKRLIAKGILCNKCYICNMLPIWNNKSLVMRLDHINGISNDNRIENLRLVCPNCDSQLPTFCGANTARIGVPRRRPDKKCPDCSKLIMRDSKRCRRCANRAMEHPKKILWPAVDVVRSMLQSQSFVSVGKQLGVSDNAVRDFLSRDNGAIVQR